MTVEESSDSSFCINVIGLIWFVVGLFVSLVSFQFGQFLTGIVAVILGVAPPGYLFYTRIKKAKEELPIRGFKVPLYTPTHRISPIKQKE